MADVPGRKPELPLTLRKLPTLLLTAVALGIAAPAAGQEAGGDGGVRGLLEVRLSGTELVGEASALFGLGAGLQVGEGWNLGGAGFLLLSDIGLGEIELRELEMVVGYGGIFAEYGRTGGPGGARWFGRLLVGWGNADVRDRATEVAVDSDNFVVAEPSIGAGHRLTERLEVNASLSYRLVDGVEDLAGIEASDLRSFGFQVGLRFSPL